MKNHLNRRKFILTGATAAAGISTFGLPSFAITGKKKMDQQLHLGIIGCGSRGRGLASILQNLPGLSVTGCCDTNEDNLSRGMKLASTKAKGYSDYRKLLENKELDAVIIASPLHLHYEMGMDALDAGKHVYMEKTITHTIEQAISLGKKVNKSPLVFQVGHQYRYYGLYHKVKEILENGWIGKVHQYECQYHSNHDWRRPVPENGSEKLVNWRMYREFSGGLMAELCAHQIDIVNWFTENAPSKVTGVGALDHWKDGREIFDHVRTLYHYPNGAMASVSSVLSNAYKGYSIRILGTEGTVEIQRDKAFIFSEGKNLDLGVVDGVSGATVKNWTQGDAVPVIFGSPDGKNLEPTHYALMDFANCIRENNRPFACIDKGKEVAIAVHLGNKAMEEENFQYWDPSYTA